MRDFMEKVMYSAFGSAILISVYTFMILLALFMAIYEATH